jgi:hypothetical protein
MITKLYSAAILLSALALVVTTDRAADAQAATARPLITQAVNGSAVTVLAGNTRPEARNAANDLGAAPENQQIPHMMLQLRRPAEQEQALNTLITELHDPQSPNYQHWLTPSEIGAQFGLAQSDIQAISNWLQQQGFTINSVYPNRMVIDYSGTAAQVRTAFRTDIHNFNVNGAGSCRDRLAQRFPPETFDAAAASGIFQRRVCLWRWIYVSLQPADAARSRDNLQLQPSVHGGQGRPGSDHRFDRGYKSLY